VVLRFRYADKIPQFLRNKYFLTITIFIVWITLLDTNNLIDRYRQMSDLRKLRQEKEYYQKKIKDEKSKLNELKTDNDNLEKFAREQYKMKKKDEDLYIVLTPQEERNISISFPLNSIAHASFINSYEASLAGTFVNKPWCVKFKYFTTLNILNQSKNRFLKASADDVLFLISAILPHHSSGCIKDLIEGGICS
jgi:cell division protein DivIC